MTEPNGFEQELRERLKDSTANIAAGDDLQRRLMDVAAAPAGAPTASRWSRAFRTTWTLPAAAAVVTVLVAGTAVVAVRAASSPTVIPGTAGGTPPPPAATSSAPARVLRASCSAPAGGSVEPATEQEFVQKIVGTWLLCKKPSAFGKDDAGLLISSDGGWARLVRNKAGDLVPASDLNSRGTWQVIDDSQMNGQPVFQINFHVPGGGTYIMLAQFAAAVSRIHLDNNGELEADYIPTSLPVVQG